MRRRTDDVGYRRPVEADDPCQSPDGQEALHELSRLIPDATQRVLTQQLRELEADGMITRQVFPEVPPRVEYEATDLARSVAPILGSLRSWGNEFRANQQRMSELEPH